jgi:alkylhydroperoxidase family enzyme
LKNRINQIEPGSNPDLKDIEEKILAARGKISPLYRTLLNSRDIAIGWESLISAVRLKNSLPASIREICILRVASLNKSLYEFEAHRIPAQQAGLSNQQIDNLLIEIDISLFSTQELIAIQLADAMTKEIEVSDQLFASIAEHFNDREILELVTTVSSYNMVSRFLTALKISY